MQCSFLRIRSSWFNSMYMREGLLCTLNCYFVVKIQTFKPCACFSLSWGNIVVKLRLQILATASCLMFYLKADLDWTQVFMEICVYLIIRVAEDNFF